MNEPAPVRVVGAILRRDDTMLLCHRHPDREWYPDVWDIPGGHVEAGEQPADALRRELQEELAVELPAPLGPPFATLADADAALEMSVWIVDYDGVVVNEAPEEHDELRWVPFDEVAALKLAHPSYVELFARAASA